MRVGRVHSHCHPHCLQRYHYVTRLHLNSVQPALRACYLLRLARARGSLYSCRARKAPLGPAGPPGPPNDGRGDGGDNDGQDHGPKNEVQASMEKIDSRKDGVIILDVSGMHCGSCASRVKQILQKHPNVSQANVNLATEVALVRVQLSPGAHTNAPGSKDGADISAIAQQLVMSLSEHGFKAGVRDKQQTNAAASAIVQSRHEERISQ